MKVKLLRILLINLMSISSYVVLCIAYLLLFAVFLFRGCITPSSIRVVDRKTYKFIMFITKIS